MRVAVVGMGKIGLPLAVHYAGSGPVTQVVGVDVNEQLVNCINQGNEPFPGESQLQQKLRKVVDASQLRATTDYALAVCTADVVIVAVPLLVDAEHQPDFGMLDSATQSIAQNLRPENQTLVIYETTLPLGTTRGRWVKQLEEQSDLTSGKDFYVAYSPERVLTGRVFADLSRYPKLVGGVDELAGQKARSFYEGSIAFDERPELPKPNGVWDLGSAEAAEMAKLAETTYRDVNIGLANQFANHAAAHGVDVYDVIQACNSQPYSHIHQPGIAVGGHCIPVYPHLYLHGDPDATIVREAREVNKGNVGKCVETITKHVGSMEGMEVAVLGLAYRGGVKEDACSGAHDLVRVLERLGANVRVHDPLFSDGEIKDRGYSPYSLGSPCTVAVLQADHHEYEDLTEQSLPGCRLFFDGRNTPNLPPGIAEKTLVIGKPYVGK